MKVILQDGVIERQGFHSSTLIARGWLFAFSPREAPRAVVGRLRGERAGVRAEALIGHRQGIVRPRGTKSLTGMELGWLGGRDSNPDTVVQSHVSYRWTTSQY